MKAKTKRTLKACYRSTLGLLWTVIKALAVWLATQAAKDLLKRSVKSTAIPVWLVVFGLSVSSLAIFLTGYLVVYFIAIAVQNYAAGDGHAIRHT